MYTENLLILEMLHDPQPLLLSKKAKRDLLRQKSGFLHSLSSSVRLRLASTTKMWGQSRRRFHPSRHESFVKLCDEDELAGPVRGAYVRPSDSTSNGPPRRLAVPASSPTRFVNELYQRHICKMMSKVPPFEQRVDVQRVEA